MPPRSRHRDGGRGRIRDGRGYCPSLEPIVSKSRRAWRLPHRAVCRLVCGTGSAKTCFRCADILFGTSTHPRSGPCPLHAEKSAMAVAAAGRRGGFFLSFAVGAKTRTWADAAPPSTMARLRSRCLCRPRAECMACLWSSDIRHLEPAHVVDASTFFPPKWSRSALDRNGPDWRRICLWPWIC